MSFDMIKKNFGFGAMRLKMTDGEVDYAEFCRMIDAFLDAGFNYFDTAHGYIDGKSEIAIGKCLSARHPRESFVLANKLSEWYVPEEKDVIPFFEEQLRVCGVDYFDFYLLHSVNRKNYEKYKALNAFEILRRLKDEGRIRHIAMSFHDTADILDAILSEQPDIEVVQLQINYLDVDDPAVQSRACHEVALKHGKRIIVMEPVKGGTLANLPSSAAEVFDGLGGGKSHASYALRYAASLPGVFMVLSGMGNMDMMRDNIGTMGDFVPLASEELAACDRARALIRESNMIGCTGCNYCAELCPQEIGISGIFSAYNSYAMALVNREEARAQIVGSGVKMPYDCIDCGACESVCPQAIAIREKLALVSKKLKLDK